MSQQSSTCPSDQVDVVVKIGGSACTKKAEFETLNVESLEASAEQLATLKAEGVSMAVIHGAGSFGHHQARQFGVSKGTAAEEGDVSAEILSAKLLEGVAKTRLSVTTLSHHVITALLKHGLPAVAISPFPFVVTENKQVPGGALSDDTAAAIVGLVKRRLVPVVHGDVVVDSAQGVAILSGDFWMVELSRKLQAKSAVFITDVDGVFTKPPSEPDAELVREILVDTQTGELELGGVSMSTASHDVTGGLKNKLENAAEVLMQAPLVKAVHIVRAGSSSAVQAMRGEMPTTGTTLKRK